MPSARLRVAWLIASIAVLVLAGLRVWQNVEAARWPARVQARQAAQANGSLALFTAFRPHYRDDWTGVTAAFPNGARYRWTPAPPPADGASTLADLKTTGTIEVRFAGGRVAGYGSAAPLALPPIPMPPLWAEADVVHQLLLYLLPAAWVIGTLLSLFVLRVGPDRRRFRALACLAAVWTVVMLTLPQWFMRPFRVGADLDDWLWPLLALGLSLLLMRLARPEVHDPMRCRACGYDLTGNVSGVCPECGTRRPLAARAAIADNAADARHR